MSWIFNAVKFNIFHMERCQVQYSYLRGSEFDVEMLKSEPAGLSKTQRHTNLTFNCQTSPIYTLENYNLYKFDV